MIIEIGSDGKMLVKSDKPLTDIERGVAEHVKEKLNEG